MRSRRQRLGSDRWRRRLSAVLIVAGLMLILLPRIHDGYSWAQQMLMARGIYILGAPTEPALIGDPPPTTTPADPTPADPPTNPAPAQPAGPVWRLNIPKIKVNAIMVYGTTPSQLAKGPGVYKQGVKPGEHGNLSIAGHRNAYGSWFRHLDRIEPGDEMYVAVDTTAYFYTVEQVFVTVPTDWSVVAPTGYDAITLTTCHPYGATTHRLIVRGRLDRVVESYVKPR